MESWPTHPHSVEGSGGRSAAGVLFQFSSLTWERARCQKIRCPKRENLHEVFFEEHFTSFLKNIFAVSKSSLRSVGQALFLFKNFFNSYFNCLRFSTSWCTIFVPYLVIMPTCPHGQHVPPIHAATTFSNSSFDLALSFFNSLRRDSFLLCTSEEIMAACQKVEEQGHMMDSVLDPAILVWQSCINYIFFVIYYIL